MFTTFLKGKTALVTGSVSGIGLGIARCLSAAGSNIVLNGFIAESEAKKLEKELTFGSQSAKFIHADLTKPSETKAMIEKAVSHFGKIDILVNNAGIQYVDTVENFPEEMWEKIIAVNLSASFYTTKYTLPDMKKRGWGRIINISSVHGLVSSVNKTAYVAAKHGIVGFTKTVALENAKTGVTCNAICPGFVLTPLIQKQLEMKAEANNVSIEQAEKILLAQKVPSGQICKAEEIGNMAVYLCSESAKQIQGVSYAIDGGWTAQ